MGYVSAWVHGGYLLWSFNGLLAGILLVIIYIMKYMGCWNQSAREMFCVSMDWFRKLLTNPNSARRNAYENLEKEILLSRLESVIRIDPESGEEMDDRTLTRIGWLTLVKFKLAIYLHRALKLEVTTEGDTLANRKQCELLLRKLSELRCTVEVVAKSRLLDGKSELLVEDVQRVVRNAEALVRDCSIPHSSRRLVTAILQVDMKESFSNILYDLQWYRLILLSILADNSGEVRTMLELAMSSGLSGECETILLRAAREDRQSLMDCIKSWKLSDSEQILASQVLGYLQEQLAMENGKEPSAIVPTSPHFLQVHPNDLKFMGSVIGEGRSLVRKTSWLGSTFAMKECHIDLCGEHTLDSVVQIPDEVTAFKKLGRHPNIVPLLCYAARGDRYFLVMEQMHTDLGAYLRELKREGAHLTLVSAVGMMLQIAEGVKYIHSKKMAHRDIKSPNILLNLANPEDVRSRICAVKVADFGLIKMKDVSRTHDNQTLGTGTTRWMAPEVHKVAPGSMAKSRLNARKIDVYSFAIVCAEILSLDNPFPNVLNIKEHVRVGHRPVLPDDCPDMLATLIKSCWDQRPQERPKFETVCRKLRYIKGILVRDLNFGIEKRENQADVVEIEMTATMLIWRFFKSLELRFGIVNSERIGNTLSAGLYLLHYVRDSVLLCVYCVLWKKDIADCFCPGPFFLYLVFLVLRPFLTAVVYKVKFPLEEYPLRSAYLLPFVRIRRFIADIFMPEFNVSGSDTSKSSETESLFAALAAIDCGLQTILQFIILHFIAINHGSTLPVLVICLIFSFLSASYNMGRALMFQMSKRWSFILNATGIIGGMYTFGALLLRCITVTSIILQLWHFSVPERFDHAPKIYFAILISVTILYFSVGLCLMSYTVGLLLVLSHKRRACSWAAQLEVIVVAYINAILGPLYPTVQYGYKDKTSGNPRGRVCKCIALATTLNMLPDVLAWVILALLQKSICGQRYVFIVYQSMQESRGGGCHQIKGYVGLILVLTILSCNLCYWFHSTFVPGFATYHVAGGWCQYVPSEIVVVSEREDITPSESSLMDKLV